MTRAQEILKLHEGTLKKLARTGAYGYIGYKIARPLIPKIVRNLEPAIGAAISKAKETGITPETVKSYGREYAKETIYPYLKSKGIDISGLLNK